MCKEYSFFFSFFCGIFLSTSLELTDVVIRPTITIEKRSMVYAMTTDGLQRKTSEMLKKVHGLVFFHCSD